MRVWRAPHAEISPQWTLLLDTTESHRLATLRQAADRARFLTGCVLLRIALGRHLGITPRDVTLDRRCPDCARPHGQVRVPGVHVSVSHSGDWVLVALSGDAPVGVDVEMVADRSDTAALANRVLAPDEQAALESLPVPLRAAGFVRYWCRKEAVLKATGERFRGRRDVLYEWGTVAGEVGDYGLNAWLCGRTLADGGPLSPKDSKVGLAGLGVAFRELFAASQEKAFAAGQAACGQLGLRLEEPDATSRGYFEKHTADGRRNGIDAFSPQQAVDAIGRAVILGAYEVEPDNDPVFFEKLIGEPDGYRYTALLRMIGGTKVTPAPQRTKDRPGRRK